MTNYFWEHGTEEKFGGLFKSVVITDAITDTKKTFFVDTNILDVSEFANNYIKQKKEQDRLLIEQQPEKQREQNIINFFRREYHSTYPYGGELSLSEIRTTLATQDYGFSTKDPLYKEIEEYVFDPVKFGKENPLRANEIEKKLFHDLNVDITDASFVNASEYIANLIDPNIENYDEIMQGLNNLTLRTSDGLKLGEYFYSDLIMNINSQISELESVSESGMISAFERTRMNQQIDRLRNQLQAYEQMKNAIETDQTIWTWQPTSEQKRLGYKIARRGIPYAMGAIAATVYSVVSAPASIGTGGTHYAAVPKVFSKTAMLGNIVTDAALNVIFSDQVLNAFNLSEDQKTVLNDRIYGAMDSTGLNVAFGLATVADGLYKIKTAKDVFIPFLSKSFLGKKYASSVLKAEAWAKLKYGVDAKGIKVATNYILPAVENAFSGAIRLGTVGALTDGGIKPIGEKIDDAKKGFIRGAGFGAVFGNFNPLISSGLKNIFGINPAGPIGYTTRLLANILTTKVTREGLAKAVGQEIPQGDSWYERLLMFDINDPISWQGPLMDLIFAISMSRDKRTWEQSITQGRLIKQNSYALMFKEKMFSDIINPKNKVNIKGMLDNISNEEARAVVSESLNKNFFSAMDHIQKKLTKEQVKEIFTSPKNEDVIKLLVTESGGEFFTKLREIGETTKNADVKEIYNEAVKVLGGDYFNAIITQELADMGNRGKLIDEANRRLRDGDYKDDVHKQQLEAIVEKNTVINNKMAETISKVKPFEKEQTRGLEFVDEQSIADFEAMHGLKAKATVDAVRDSVTGKVSKRDFAAIKELMTIEKNTVMEIDDVRKMVENFRVKFNLTSKEAERKLTEIAEKQVFEGEIQNPDGTRGSILNVKLSLSEWIKLNNFIDLAEKEAELASGRAVQKDSSKFALIKHQLSNLIERIKGNEIKNVTEKDIHELKEFAESDVIRDKPKNALQDLLNTYNTKQVPSAVNEFLSDKLKDIEREIDRQAREVKGKKYKANLKKFYKTDQIEKLLSKEIDEDKKVVKPITRGNLVDYQEVIQKFEHLGSLKEGEVGSVSSQKLRDAMEKEGYVMSKRLGMLTKFFSQAKAHAKIYGWEIVSAKQLSGSTMLNSDRISKLLSDGKFKDAGQEIHLETLFPDGPTTIGDFVVLKNSRYGIGYEKGTNNLFYLYKHNDYHNVYKYGQVLRRVNSSVADALLKRVDKTANEFYKRNGDFADMEKIQRILTYNDEIKKDVVAGRLKEFEKNIPNIQKQIELLVKDKTIAAEDRKELSQKLKDLNSIKEDLSKIKDINLFINKQKDMLRKLKRRNDRLDVDKALMRLHAHETFLELREKNIRDNMAKVSYFGGQKEQIEQRVRELTPMPKTNYLTKYQKIVEKADRNPKIMAQQKKSIKAFEDQIKQIEENYAKQTEIEKILNEQLQEKTILEKELNSKILKLKVIQQRIPEERAKIQEQLRFKKNETEFFEDGELNDNIINTAKELRDIFDQNIEYAQEMGLTVIRKSNYFPTVDEINRAGDYSKGDKMVFGEVFEEYEFRPKPREYYSKTKKGVELKIVDDIFDKVLRYSSRIRKDGTFSSYLKYLRDHYVDQDAARLLPSETKEFLIQHTKRVMGIDSQFNKNFYTSIATSINAGIDIAKGSSMVTPEQVKATYLKLIEYNYASALASPRHWIRNLAVQPFSLTMPFVGMKNTFSSLYELAKMFTKDGFKDTVQRLRNFMAEHHLRHEKGFAEGLEQFNKEFKHNTKFQKSIDFTDDMAKAALYGFDTSDLINRFITYNAAAKNFDQVMTKNLTTNEFLKKINANLLDPAQFDELKMLIDKKDFVSAKELYSRYVTHTTQFLYGASESPLIMGNAFARMFTQYKSWGTFYLGFMNEVIHEAIHPKVEGGRMNAMSYMAQHFLAQIALLSAARHIGIRGRDFLASASVPVVGNTVGYLMDTTIDVFNPFEDKDDFRMYEKIDQFDKLSVINNLVSVPAIGGIGATILGAGNFALEYIGMDDEDAVERRWNTLKRSAFTGVTSLTPFGAIMRDVKTLITNKDVATGRETLLSIIGLKHYSEPEQYKTLRLIEDEIQKSNGMITEEFLTRVQSGYNSITGKTISEQTIRNYLTTLNEFHGEGIINLPVSDIVKYSRILTNARRREQYIINAYERKISGDITPQEYLKRIRDLMAVFPDITHNRVNNIIKEYKKEEVRKKISLTR